MKKLILVAVSGLYLAAIAPVALATAPISETTQQDTLIIDLTGGCCTPAGCGDCDPD